MPKLRPIDEIRKTPKLRPIEEITGTTPSPQDIFDKVKKFFPWMKDDTGEAIPAYEPLFPEHEPAMPLDVKEAIAAGEEYASREKWDPQTTTGKVFKDFGNFIMSVPDIVTKVIPQTALHAVTSGPRILSNLGVDMPVKPKPISEVAPYSLGQPAPMRELGEWFSAYLFDVPFWKDDPLQKHLKEPLFDELKKLGLVGEDFNASTFEKNWDEHPGYVILDLAVAADLGLRAPTIAASRIGKNLSKIKVATEIAQAKPGAAADFTKLVEKGFSIDEAIGIMAEHYVPSVGKAAQKGGQALKGTMPEKMMKFGSRERAPLQVGGEEIARKYNPNVAYRGIQVGLERARAKVPGIENLLSGVETTLGIHPGQRAWDMIFRAEDARVQRLVEGKSKAVRRSLGKLTKAERADFFKTIEAMHIDEATGKIHRRPYTIEIGREYVKALDEYEIYVQAVRQAYKDAGLELPLTDAPHTTRAATKFIDKKIAEGMTKEDAIKAWDDLREEPEMVKVERQKDVAEWFGKDEPPVTPEVPKEPGPKPPAKPVTPEVAPEAVAKPKPAPKPPAKAKPVAKEPWEMTYQEWKDNLRDEWVAKTDKPNVIDDIKYQHEVEGRYFARNNHKAEIEAALSEGKPVPPEVLADYPGLAKGAAKAKLPGKPSTKPLKLPAKTAGVELTASKQITFQGKEAPLWARRISVDDILTDPERFQFKLKVDPKSGESIAMKGAQKWKEYAADRIFIWEDDAGKLWVVDGHHRLALAKRLGVKDIDAYVFRAADGITAAEARTIGALNNLMKGTGTAADAAKFLRDTGMSVKQLAQEGVSASSTLIEHGVALSKLSDDVFRMVINEDITIPQGAAIGRGLAKHPDLQLKAAKKVIEGKASSVGDIEMLADMMKETAYKTIDDTLLFPAEVTEALVDERLAILGSVKRRLKADKSAFGAIVRNARKYEEVGNVLEKNKNLAMKEKSALIEGIISKRATQKGPWSDYLTELAEKYKQNPTKRALEDLTDEYIRFIETADWGSGKLPGGIGGAPGTGGPKAPKAGPAGFIDWKDQKGALNLEPVQKFLDRFRKDKKLQQKELVKYNVKAPKYFPHLFDKPGKSFWRGDDLPTRMHKGKIPEAKFRGGALGYTTDPQRAVATMALRMKAVLKEKAIFDRAMEWVVKNEKGAPKLLKYGEKIPDGYTAFFPEGRLRTEMAAQKLFKEMAPILRDGGDLLDAFWAGVNEVFSSGDKLAGFLKGGNKVYLLPDVAAKQLRAHMKPLRSLGKYDALYKNYRQLWVDSILTGMFTTRWQKNNFIGGVLMSLLDGSIIYVPEAIRWKLCKELQDLIPPEYTGGGLVGSLEGGRPWRALKNTWWGRNISKPRKQIAGVFYGINNIVDDLFRSAAYIKRMKLHIRKAMIKKGYKDTGSLVLDSIDNLSVDDLASILQDIRKSDPHLSERIALDVSRNVYDFALKSPFEKYLSTYWVPFGQWWKFVNSWALSLAVYSPGKVNLLQKIGKISTDIKRYEFDSLGLTDDEGDPLKWDDLPAYMRFWTPVNYDKESGILRWRYDYGVNPFNDLFDVKQLVSAGLLTGPVLEFAQRYDSFTGKEIKGAEAAAWSGDVPEFAKADDAINFGLNRVWSLFTDRVPYAGNVADLIYKIARPYAEYPTAHPFGPPQPYKDAEGNIKYPHHGNPLEKLWKLMGVSFKSMSIENLRTKIKREKAEAKEVWNRKHPDQKVE